MQNHLTQKKILSFQMTKSDPCLDHIQKDLSDLYKGSSWWAVLLFHSYPCYYSNLHKINGLIQKSPGLLHSIKNCSLQE